MGWECGGVGWDCVVCVACVVCAVCVCVRRVVCCVWRAWLCVVCMCCVFMCCVSLSMSWIADWFRRLTVSFCLPARSALAFVHLFILIVAIALAFRLFTDLLACAACVSGLLPLGCLLLFVASAVLRSAVRARCACSLVCSFWLFLFAAFCLLLSLRCALLSAC